ncbi:hypothetical protein [Domibacillus aminovorans]|uniref:hypothetical protein n=1 Tax=Domibacillus aminovorans TaxID=29332 RepID=UPI0012FD6BFD|nr:hypothetical protein [Domibacillus aminovorans]
MPVVRRPPHGTELVAASSNVKVRLVTPVPESGSDIRMVFVVPSGATSITSTSKGKVWENPLRVAVTLVIVPSRPATLITEG